MQGTLLYCAVESLGIVHVGSQTPPRKPSNKGLDLDQNPYKPSFRSPFKMTSRKKEKEEGILERVLESLKSIGQNVERIMYRSHFYNAGAEQEKDDEDELTLDELYENENGEY
jgi:hypothetical protein